MARLNLFLLLAVLGCAFLIVHTEYRSRQLFTELYRANAEGNRLEVDRDRLEIEKRAQATPTRVEKMAREQLKMRTPTPAITQYVGSDGAIAPGSALPAVIEEMPEPKPAERKPGARRGAAATGSPAGEAPTSSSAKVRR